MNFENVLPNEYGWSTLQNTFKSIYATNQIALLLVTS